jgi:hypothetical protein
MGCASCCAARRTSCRWPGAASLPGGPHREGDRKIQRPRCGSLRRLSGRDQPRRGVLRGLAPGRRPTWRWGACAHRANWQARRHRQEPVANRRPQRGLATVSQVSRPRARRLVRVRSHQGRARLRRGGRQPASPTPGSAYVLLHHVFGEVNGKQGAWGHAIGGMGAITQAMALPASTACASCGLGGPRGHRGAGRATGVVLMMARHSGARGHCQRRSATAFPGPGAAQGGRLRWRRA